MGRAFGRMLSIGPIKQDHSTMKHPLSSRAGHVRRRYNGNAPPPGVPLSAVPVSAGSPLSSRGLCEMTRRHRRRRINALQTSINTSQTVAESAGRDARALRVRRAGWGLTRVDRPAHPLRVPGGSAGAARVSRVCVDRRLHVWRRRETLTCQQVTPTFSLDLPACGGRPLS